MNSGFTTYFTRGAESSTNHNSSYLQHRGQPAGDLRTTYYQPATGPYPVSPLVASPDPDLPTGSSKDKGRHRSCDFAALHRKDCISASNPADFLPQRSRFLLEASSRGQPSHPVKRIKRADRHFSAEHLKAARKTALCSGSLPLRREPPSVCFSPGPR